MKFAILINTFTSNKGSGGGRGELGDGHTSKEENIQSCCVPHFPKPVLMS